MANRESAPVSQACAACKHQRKRCDRNCALAPYFPASKYLEFQDVHKLFGVSNIHKILAAVEPHQREAAAKTLIIEGHIRRRDPVRGCHGVIKKLTAQIEMYQKELSLVKQQLAIHKEQQDQKEEEDESNDFPDLPCELLDDMRKFEQGYYEMSNLEEGEDDEKYSIDMDILEAVDDHGKSLAYNNSAGKSGFAAAFEGQECLEFVKKIKTADEAGLSKGQKPRECVKKIKTEGQAGTSSDDADQESCSIY